MKYKIEKGIGLKAPFEKGTVSKAMYDALKKCTIRDSFVIENPHYTTFIFVKEIPEFQGKIFTSRTEDSKHKRIWRIK